MNVFKVLHIFLRSFLLAQKRTKKGSRSLDPQNADFPALLAKNGRHRKVVSLAGYSAESLIRSLRNLYPVFRGTARLREMAKNKELFILVDWQGNGNTLSGLFQRKTLQRFI
jgi:hypothetical protein